jgi:hypothetical protein
MKKQSIKTLINKESQLFTKYLRSEIRKWKPRRLSLGASDMPYRMMKSVLRNEYATSIKYLTTFFVKLSYENCEIIRRFGLQDGDIIRCEVLGLFDSLHRLLKNINDDYDFEVSGAVAYWTTSLYLPEDLVMEYGIEKNQYLDLILKLVIKRRKGKTYSKKIYNKRVVNEQFFVKPNMM